MLFISIYKIKYFKNRILTKVKKMKLEELLAPCPKCGSQDKVAKRKLLDNHRAHAEMEAVKCSEWVHKIKWLKENYWTITEPMQKWKL